MTIAQITTSESNINYALSDKIYWLNELADELPETKLIADYKRLGLTHGAIKSYDFELSPDISQTIFKFCQQSHLSLYLFLLSAFNILLYKYTDSQELAIGSPLYKFEAKDNFNSAIIPLRFNLKDVLTFQDFLLEVRDKTIKAYCHQDYPFHRLDSSVSIVVLLENIHDFIKSNDCELLLALRLEKNIIKGSIKYNNLLFAPETINNLVDRYVNLVELLINNIELKIAEIPWLTTKERKLLLKNFNNTKEYPVSFTLHQLFERQVVQTPTKIAAIDRSRRITYQELNQQANQLARYLQYLGVKSGDFVAILKQRDLHFLIAILAILKTGGVYVPIDSSYPPERIKYMVNNSQVKMLLTDSFSLNSLTDLLVNCSNLEHLICLDINSEPQQTTQSNHFKISYRIDFEHLSQENLEISNQGVDPAYMIYTSGSTGLPKGAIIRHGGAINHIYAQYDALKLTSDLNFLQSAPASSDISVWQFLAPILIGGKTVIIDTETICQPDKLWQTIQQEQITIVELVPLVLRSLLDYLACLSTENRCLPHLQWMMVTGESVAVDLVNEWLNYYPSIAVVNAYGPTEAADDITQLIIDRPLPKNQKTVSIGKPLANLNIYILDRALQLVPIGVPGEICVSGYGVGLGYWQNQTATNSSFIVNPFSENSQPLPGVDTDLLYKTGDLARWLPDGNLEFLGRIDNQVKIRGFRIELGEIESLLTQHPNVREAVVIVREDLSKYKRLVAYIVPRQEQNQLIAELRHLLQANLPEHMIPSAFVLLERLPQTPSGKIDRQALPKPEIETTELTNTFVLPQTAIEATLANIWAEVLGLETVGIQDNFFELGGDSILCIQVIAKAHQQELNITPKQVFEYQTIAELARVVDTTENLVAEQGLVTGNIPLTPIQHYFFDQNLPHPHHWHETVLLASKQVLEPQLVEEAIGELLLHHDALRLRFDKKQSVWQQTNAPLQETIPFSYFDLSTLPVDRQQTTIETTARRLQASFDLSQGVLIKVVLFNLGATNRLLIIIHHLAVDSLSWRILLEDLQNAYEQLQARVKIKLPPKTTSFQQWSHKLTDYANSETLKQELTYWLVESRHTSLTSIPVDYPGGANTEALAATVSAQLDRTQTQILLQEVPGVYRTQIDDVLLTALLFSFREWTGQKSLLVNLESHGREELFDGVNLSRTVGLFSTIFPVYLEIQDNTNPGQALKSIKEQLRKIPTGGIGYGLLRYLIQDFAVRESLELMPSPEVVFNYLGQFDRTLSESSLFNLVDESVGESSSPENNRNHLLSFNSFVIGGQLQLNCTYSQALYHSTTIEKLTQGFLKALRSLISYCQSDEAGGVTPSDFPLVELNQTELDEVLGMVEF
jgi:amino acid adenylation domain-containing protein/non-ribosomal peptide synthase protein (TIGR01720 family)